MVSDKVIFILAYPKSGTQDLRFLVGLRPVIQDPSCGWDPEPDTRDPNGEKRVPRLGTHLKGGTRDLRPSTPRVGPETQNPYFKWDPRPEAQDTKRDLVLL